MYAKDFFNLTKYWKVAVWNSLLVMHEQMQLLIDVGTETRNRPEKPYNTPKRTVNTSIRSRPSSP